MRGIANLPHQSTETRNLVLAVVDGLLSVHLSGVSFGLRHSSEWLFIAAGRSLPISLATTLDMAFTALDLLPHNAALAPVS